MNHRPGLLVSLLTLLALTAGPAAGAWAASAPTLAGLETAVGRSTPPTSALVGSQPLRSGITSRVATHGYDRIAVATGVAAEDGAGALDDLSASGAELDPADAGGQLTRAGRALAKAKEVFGPTAGGPAAINEAGQNALDEILTNPGTAERVMRGGNFAGGKVFISPDGIGAVFSPSGEFEYFGRMPYP